MENSMKVKNCPFPLGEGGRGIEVVVFKINLPNPLLQEGIAL